MGRGEFEEILEECLSALLEGRRSVEQSLSLYPAWRGRLEPLLRAAEDMAAAYRQDPAFYVRERGLQRFLEAARVRRRLRQLLPRERRPVPRGRWATGAVGAAVAVGVLALLSATLLSSEGHSLGRVAVSVSPYVPPDEARLPRAEEETSLERLQKGVAELETSVREDDPIEVSLLVGLESASVEVAEQVDDGDLIERVAASSAAARGYELLSKVRSEQPSGQGAVAAQRGMIAAANVLERLGAPIPTPTPTPSPSPSPTAESSPVATALAPSPEATATPSPTPIDSGSDSPEASAASELVPGPEGQVD